MTTTEKTMLISKIRENQAESGKYSDAQMEKSYKKLILLDNEKLAGLSKMNGANLKKAGY